MGVVGRPGAPERPTDLDVEHYLWFIEGVLREMPGYIQSLDDLYEDARKRLNPVAAGEQRSRDIEAFLGAVLN